MEYKKQHIGNVFIENESTSPRTLPISVHIDTLGAATISIGDTISIRTNEFGLDDLRSILHEASVALMNQKNKKKKI